MTVSMLVAFWGVSILFVITPGADWAYVIAAGLRERAAVPAVGGLLLGHLVATVVVAAGVGALVAGIPLALAALTVAGSSYLLWLGVGLLLDPPVPTADVNSDSVSWKRWATKGFGVSGLNPKVFLLFLALLPQFTDPTAPWPVPAQMVALGLVHVATCAVVYAGVAYGSKAILRTRPAAARLIGRFSGAAMIAIATLLLAEQFMG